MHSLKVNQSDKSPAQYSLCSLSHVARFHESQSVVVRGFLHREERLCACLQPQYLTSVLGGGDKARIVFQMVTS
jgi:hypothetical protein